ncbi:MAG: CorA family divalent cation transporter, partial [Nioella sp.]
MTFIITRNLRCQKPLNTLATPFIDRLPGMPPGTLTLPEGRKKEKAKIELLRYSPQEVLEKELSSIKDILEEKKDRSVMWVNIEGINDLDTLEEVGEIFGMHPLHLEDILNTDQRPKLEEHEGYLFLAMKMIYLRGEADDIEYEHLSVFVSDDTVITFQQRQGDVFDPVRDRIRKAK